MHLGVCFVTFALLRLFVSQFLRGCFCTEIIEYDDDVA